MAEQRRTTNRKCRLCGSELEHKVYYVKEMFFGTREEFAYFECETCQCIQIMDVPENLGKFYGRDYYSFSEQVIRQPTNSRQIETRILDVGCGSGKWLLEKYKQGHIHLFGCDPFIERDISYEPYIHIKKCTIHEMEGTFDLIRLCDSFEHMEDPFEALVSIKRLLDDFGMCLISIPVYPNAAFDIFKEYWYEWDAPRHLFLYSVKSMDYLCRKVGLRIGSINFNSSNSQFISSLLYQQGIPYLEQDENVIKNHFSQAELDQFARIAAELNEKQYGDHAVFAIVKG